jgi:type IV pilus assembly protein PilM
MSLFGNKIESFIGVDIGAHGIKLVELRSTNGRPQLWTYGIVEEKTAIHPLPGDHSLPELASAKVTPTAQKTNTENEFSLERADLIGTTLAQVIQKSRVNGRRAASSLPVSHIFHTIINLPKVSEKEIDGLVQAEVAKVLPLPADQMQLVYQTVPLPEALGKNYIRLLVTAAPKNMVDFYTRIFSRAGLQLQELETEAFALSRSLVGKDESLTMLVDIGAERTNFSLIDKGLPMTQRSLHLGGTILDEIIADRLGVSTQEAQFIKRDISFSNSTPISLDPFIRFLEPLAKEIQYHFDLYLSQTGNEGRKPEKIVLTGGAALFPPVLEYLRNQFQLRVFIGDPWARVLYQDGLKPTLNEIAPRMAVALGLALRHF